MSDARYAQTLGSRKWRLIHSTWLFWPIALFGAATAFAFLYVGLRAKKPRWYIPGIIYGVVALAGWVMVGVADLESAISDVGMGLLLLGWVAGMIHAALINGPWLKWLAEEHVHISAYRGAATATVSQEAAPAMAALGIEPSTFYAPPASPVPFAEPATTGQLDVNTASEAELAALPGIDALSARDIVAHRTASGPFRTIEEFALVSRMQPHVFASARTNLTCSTPPTEQRVTGRVLDF